MDLNTFLFTKTAPKKKLEVVNSASEVDLLHLTFASILRMIKEAGRGDSGKARNKFKTLYLNPRLGNGWNSTVDSIYNWKKDTVYLSVYIQGDDTDTDCEYSLSDFLDNRYDEQCLGYLEESFNNGYSHRVPANYDRSDRAKVLRNICVAYINNKYADKLK